MNFIKGRFRVAIKDYECFHTQLPIPKGTVHRVLTFSDDGSIYTQRENPTFGNFLDFYKEVHGKHFFDIWESNEIPETAVFWFADDNPQAYMKVVKAMGLHPLRDGLIAVLANRYPETIKP